MAGVVDLANQDPGLLNTVNTSVLPVFCDACIDLEAGSNFMRALNNAPIAQPGIRYSVLATRDDFIATPAGAASFIEEPGVTNQFIQDLRPGWVDHMTIALNPVSPQWIIDQLDAADQR